MNRKQKTRLIAITCLIVVLSISAALILYALKQNINLFYTPTQVLQAEIKPEQTLRIGGYVKKNSVRFNASGESVEFVVTDRTNDLAVTYHGMLPNLFREGQTVVVTGKLDKQHILIASEVLAKHDEKYMPRPLAEKLKQGDGYGS